MKLKLAALGSAMLLAFAAGPGPASAGTMTWDFFTLAGSPSPPGKDLGSWTTTFSQGGDTMLVDSATSSGCGAFAWCPAFNNDLYAKNGGSPDEQGLGLAIDPYNSHEISNPYGIYLGLQTIGHATNVDMGSVQIGETWAVWGSNNGFTWTKLGQGTGTGALVDFNSSLLSHYDQLIVADPFLLNQDHRNSNDIVLASITTTSVPEPGAMALFGAGLLGCALFVARRRRARQS